MGLNWTRFLEDHRIEYVTHTSNTSRGRVNIRCPFCGDDPSEHLGVHLKTGRWNCWRDVHPNIPHNGARLVQELIRCTPQEARDITEGTPELLADSDFVTAARLRLGGTSRKSVPREIEFLPEFRPLAGGSLLGQPFWEYIKTRDYRDAQVRWLAENYELCYVRRGRFAWRVVFPIRDRWGKLLTWTGRAIRPDAELRYLSLSAQKQVCAPKETLLGLPLLWRCRKPRALLVCEGPFDALRVTMFGRGLGVYGTCLFGLSLQRSQMVLLDELRERFPYIALLLDSEATFQAFKLGNMGLDLNLLKLPIGYKDPAEMTATAIINLCVSVVKNLA